MAEGHQSFSAVEEWHEVCLSSGGVNSVGMQHCFYQLPFQTCWWLHQRLSTNIPNTATAESITVIWVTSGITDIQLFQSEYLLWNCCLINILYIMFQVKKTKCGFWHNLHIRGTVLTPLHSVANHGLISLISFSVFWHLHFLFNLVAPQKKIPIFRRYKV